MEENIFECKKCNYQTDKLSNLTRHCSSKQHKNILKNEEVEDNKKHICKYCGSQFAQHEGLSRHINHRCKLKDTKEGQLMRKINMQTDEINKLKNELRQSVKIENTNIIKVYLTVNNSIFN